MTPESIVMAEELTGAYSRLTGPVGPPAGFSL